MRITILTMFPELFDSFLAGPIARRAAERGIAGIRVVDIKDYAGGCYRHIDDSTYGGGAGMVMRAQPVLDALQAAIGTKASASSSMKNTADGEGQRGNACSAPGKGSADTVSGDGEAEVEGALACAFTGGREPSGTCIAALTPVGRLYRQETAVRYAHLEHLILICGHYEGMDERIYAHADERISIGDYILSGGEFAAQVVIDSILRLLPGVLRGESTAEESFGERGLLEYPQYTRPADLDGDKVPEVLLSGNHEEIRKWRLRESLRATLRERPDLLDPARLTDEERELLKEL